MRRAGHGKMVPTTAYWTTAVLRGQELVSTVFLGYSIVISSNCVPKVKWFLLPPPFPKVTFYRQLTLSFFGISVADYFKTLLFFYGTRPVVKVG